MTMSRKRIVPHRGIAMMLVLFCVTIATILATAYLVSRDNSLAISRNSSAASRARWAALSGLETAVAILQTDTDWRANHTNGMLLDGYPLAGATVTVTALDIETDLAPGPDSEYLRVLAMAEVDVNEDGTADGRQSSVLLAYVPRVTAPHVAVDTVQAGGGDLVYLVGSREAALALDPWFVPVDAAIVGIVDEVHNPERTG